MEINGKLYLFRPVFYLYAQKWLKGVGLGGLVLLGRGFDWTQMWKELP